MRKLFTLIALFTCLLGAKAITVVDAEVDYSKVTEIKYYGWGASESARARLSLQDGNLHFHSEEATDPSWDCQFHPIGGVNVEKGVTYTLHYKIKGTEAKNISALGFGQTPYGQFPITTEWVEGTVEYTATDNSGGDILMQCGDYIGDFDIAYLKITHEEREQRPVQWANILVNGDAEGEFGDVPCVQAKVWDPDPETAAIINPAEIKTIDGSKVFVVNAKAVNPPLTWAEDGEQWGTQHKAGDPMPDNAWQNQIWITLPRVAKEGEQFKLSFRYKASRAVETGTQDHRLPGDYLGGGSYGNVKFETTWQTYEKQFSAAGGMQSIAFNLGQEIYNEDMTFYLDDVTVSEMVLDHGLFVASTHTESGLVDYDFDNATPFDYDKEENLLIATVGTKGKKDSWVNQVMISTVRGNDRAFKAATLKAKAKNGDWVDFTEGSGATIDLPAAGVWIISVDTTSNKQMLFEQVEGDAPKEAIVINANPTKVVVKGQERKQTLDEAVAAGLVADKNAATDEEKEMYNGQPWDNQFFIVANRPLKAGEETFIEFKYKASAEAKTTTQTHGQPGEYKGGAINDVNFTTEEQTVSMAFEIPNLEGIQSIAFNMAEIIGACDYEIYDVIWRLDDSTESLIDQTGAKNFYVKEGAGTTPHIFGETAGINDVVKTVKVSNVTYNVAGQRVAKNFKGLVIKNGSKMLVK